MKKSSGIGLGEYGLIAAVVAIVAFAVLNALGQTLLGQFMNMIVYHQPAASTVTAQMTQGTNGATAAASGLAVSGITIPGSGLGIGLSSVIDYQALSASVQTAGANGTTKTLADSLTKLAQEQLAAGKITEAQANALFALANQSYRMGAMEAAIEKAASANNLTGDEFQYQTVMFEGKATTIDSLYVELGFLNNSSLLPDPLTAGNRSKAEMAALITAYNQAKASGALADPAIQAQVYGYTSQVATLADAVMFAAGNRSSATTNTPVDMSTNIARQLNMLDGSASTTTNNAATDICTVGNGQKLYTGNGQRCSGG